MVYNVYSPYFYHNMGGFYGAYAQESRKKTNLHNKNALFCDRCLMFLEKASEKCNKSKGGAYERFK